MRKFTCFIIFLFLNIYSGIQAQSISKNLDKVSIEKQPIIIYGSASCHYCLDVKSMLEKEKRNYVFYDIDTDKKALSEMLLKLKKANISTNNLQIPVIDKQGEIFMNNTSFDDFLKKIIQ